MTKYQNLIHRQWYWGRSKSKWWLQPLRWLRRWRGNTANTEKEQKGITRAEKEDEGDEYTG